MNFKYSKIVTLLTVLLMLAKKEHEARCLSDYKDFLFTLGTFTVRLCSFTMKIYKYDLNILGGILSG